MIERLAWDSDFFGYEVGKAKVRNDMDVDEFLMEAKNFQLVYIFSPDYLIDLPDSIQHVGTKVNLVKNITAKGNVLRFPLFPEQASPDQITEGVLEVPPLDIRTNESQENKNFQFGVYGHLIRLAWVSGGFSHFKMDGRLKNNEFERLYTEWILNSLAGKERVLVYQKEEKIRGFITLSVVETGGRIGLLAVSEESRGKGIASQLLKAAYHIASWEGEKKLEVGTQSANYPALSLYQKNGFRITDEMEVYHFTCFQD